jgi:hypothetical protein
LIPPCATYIRRSEPYKRHPINKVITGMTKHYDYSRARPPSKKTATSNSFSLLRNNRLPVLVHTKRTTQLFDLGFPFSHQFAINK